MTSLFITLLIIIDVAICLLAVLLVMMQRPSQEGLGAAFGGGVTDQMFGAQTTNVLQRGTVYMTIAFFVVNLLLSVLIARSAQKDKDLGTSLKAAIPAEMAKQGQVDPTTTTEAPKSSEGIEDSEAKTLLPTPTPIQEGKSSSSVEAPAKEATSSSPAAVTESPTKSE